MSTIFDSVKEESLSSEFYSSEEIFQNEVERILLLKLDNGLSSE